MATRDWVNQLAGSTRMLGHGQLYTGIGNLWFIEEQIERLKPDSWKGYNIASAAKVDNDPNSDMMRWALDDRDVAYPTYQKIDEYARKDHGRILKEHPGFRNLSIHKGLQTNADGSFRGAVVMVARKGKLVYQDAVGMQTASAKMTPDSIFRIYSMTKPLVSVAAMILVEDGTIQLTDSVSKFLPGFDKLQVSVPSKNDAGNTTYALVPQERQMTVQDLLRHTSGLAYGEITQNAPVKEGLE